MCAAIYDTSSPQYFGTLPLPPICDANSAQHVAAAAQLARLYTPPEMSGRGIVICGGGRYLPSTYVSVRLLRANGCQLPIQVWHLGYGEVPTNAAPLFCGLDVEFKDARALQQQFPHKRLGGWEIKAFSLLHCPWREVILLDADNLALRDITELFDLPLYKEHGAVFWPDRGRWPPTFPIWALTGLPYRDEAEFESGQILVDRARTWSAIVLANWFNHESEYWYSKIHGDKDTFRLAWRALNQEYGMIPHMASAPWPYFYQKLPDGAIVFHHGLKWSTDLNRNPRIEHVPESCYQFIAEYAAGLNVPAPCGYATKREGLHPIATSAPATVAMDQCHIDHVCGVVRALKPRHVLELGVGTGASATAILRALEENKYGQLTLVDNWYDFGGQQPASPGFEQQRVSVVTSSEESFIAAAAPVYDVIVSDADHQNSHRWWEDTLRLVRPGGCAFYHDVTFTGTPQLRHIYEESKNKYCVQLFNTSSRQDERCDRGLLCVWRPIDATISPRVAVVQFGSGAALELLRYSRPCHEHACARFGYDYICKSEPKTGRHVYWEKARMMLDAFAAGYDYVIWLDADAFWLGESDLLSVWASAPPTSALAATWHGQRKDGQQGHYYDHINTGVLFSRAYNNQGPNVLRAWLSSPETEHPWRDQHVLNELLGNQQELLHIAGHEWNSVEWVPEYSAPNPFIVAWHGKENLAAERIKHFSHEYCARYRLELVS